MSAAAREEAKCEYHQALVDVLSSISKDEKVLLVELNEGLCCPVPSSRVLMGWGPMTLPLPAANWSLCDLLRWSYETVWTVPHLRQHPIIAI